MAVTIKTGECTGCGSCIDECPNGILTMNGDVVKTSNPDECIDCGICVDACPFGAIEK
ncbi:MAG: ferredoxin family protein [Eggerthellaceae bacterium]|nr:ferredoxin family protein [Eggerthellaceae bacterium]